MRVLLVHPGARWATADVESGLRYGLEQQGVEVIRYRLDTRLTRARSWLQASWRAQQRQGQETPRPTAADVGLQAGEGVVCEALRHQVDAVLVVCAALLHPDVLVLLKRAGLRVFVLFTETPYDIAQELKVAALVDGGWTHERTALPAFRAVNPQINYLPHAWHPDVHFAGSELSDVPAHDVVFVGSGFPERITWFNSIDWTGIDLGLYGTWKGLGLKPDVEACVRGEQIDNATAAALYRKAKIGLNLYRRTRGFNAESLNPRAYELAACGCFQLNEWRKEGADKFGSVYPCFVSVETAGQAIRHCLGQDGMRRAVAARMKHVLRDDSWDQRARQVLRDYFQWMRRPAAFDVVVTTRSDAQWFDYDATARRTPIAQPVWLQGLA